MSRRGGTGACAGARPARVGVLLVLVLLLAAPGCTFERRADPADEEAEATTDEQLSPEAGTASRAGAEARARSAVEQFRDAVTVGDLSLALALLHRDATLIDAEAGRAAEAASRGEFLLELRARHLTGMHFEPIETRVLLPGDGSALVFTLLAMMEEGEEGIGEEVGRVFESVVLVDDDQGWRIRHLHRSVAPEP